MQAIILAAGMGKRLGDLTKDNTKCMIKVNGTYLIDRLLSQLDSLNLERIILVIGYQGEKLRTHIEKQSRNTPIEYIYNPVYNKTNNIYSLYLAKEELAKARYFIN
ncbi:Nucleotidyl transferase [human gut metagenome]|uniref:Nucleotidyl transferase n=1 Tax=human gut metagenome TaxID=408170 RepID=K1ST53_9ZZZZ